MTSEYLNSYIVDRLKYATRANFVDDRGHTQYICTEDALPRLSKFHTLRSGETLSNFSDRSPDVKAGMVEFYRNSLLAGQPMTADAIIASEGWGFPKELKWIRCDINGWFLFNQKTGLLSDQWWHIYGYLPSK